MKPLSPMPAHFWHTLLVYYLHKYLIDFMHEKVTRYGSMCRTYERTTTPCYVIAVTSAAQTAVQRPTQAWEI